MIVFLGGPLLDIIAYVDKTYLDKYNLKPDETIRATSDLQVIFKEILDFNPIIQPGGSVNNSARILQWISQKSYPIVFTGAIGTDEYGKIIKNTFLEEEIHTHLLEVEGIRTGICAVLLIEEKRTMVSDLGASKYMNIGRLNEKLWKHLYKAEYFYMSGFFLGVCIDLVRSIFHHFKEKHKEIIVNMAASFLSEKYPKQLTYLFKNANVVFGNEAEYKAFSNIHNLKPDNPGNMLLKLNKLFDCNPARLLIMTRGHKPLYILHNYKIEIFETMPIRKEIIVDTDGAGDAFVGGFLAQYLKNKNLEDCVKCGTWAAREIIQHQGCNFDKNKIYNSSILFYFKNT